MYNTAKILGNKYLLTKQLVELPEIGYIPKTIFLKKNDINNNLKNLIAYVTYIYQETKSFYYLKAAVGSNSAAVFIVDGINDIVNILKEYFIKPGWNVDWLLSENIQSYIYKRKGKYSENGINYNEKYGHKGQFKFFLIFKNDSDSREVYLYNKSCYAIAPLEYTGDNTSLEQNLVTGLGERSNLRDIINVPEEYDLDSDYGFTGEKIFGKDYFDKIIPQVIKISSDIFKVVHDSLNCKNDFYY
jgi:hypothetical protein